MQVTNKAASTSPYTFNPEEVARKSDPNKKLKWLVPVLFAAQIAFKVPACSPYVPSNVPCNQKDRMNRFPCLRKAGRHLIGQPLDPD